MKPAPFRYARPESLEESLAILAEHGDEAKVLAGGQSLLPMMNFRLAQPAVLVDLALVEELGGIRREDGVLVVGAMACQREAERSPLVAEAAPLLARALPWVGHLQNRNRGTVGGSIAHADPSAELPAVAVALGAELVLASIRGRRAVGAADFFHGPFATAIEPDEMLVEVQLPVRPAARAGFGEVARRHGDFALAGVAMSAELSAEGTVAGIAIAAFGVAGEPVRLERAEAALRGRCPESDVAREVAAEAMAEVERPKDDIHASGEYRRDALGALVARALRELTAS